MCPVCGTRLDLSHSPAADQIRAFIEQKRDAGWTKQQVKDALVAQFGERILATTPTSGSGLFAWLVPVIAGVAGVAIAVGLVVAWRRRPPRSTPAPAAAPLDDEARPPRRRGAARLRVTLPRPRARTGTPLPASSAARGRRLRTSAGVSSLRGPRTASRAGERRQGGGAVPPSPRPASRPATPGAAGGADAAGAVACRAGAARAAARCSGGLVVTFDGVFERVVRLRRRRPRGAAAGPPPAGAGAARSPARSSTRSRSRPPARGSPMRSAGCSTGSARRWSIRTRSRRRRPATPPARISAGCTRPGGRGSTSWQRGTRRGAGSRPASCWLARCRRGTAPSSTCRDSRTSTHAQETLVRLVAERAGAVVTLPYEPGRPAFAALSGSVAAPGRGARRSSSCRRSRASGRRASSSSSGACSSRAGRPPPSRATRACAFLEVGGGPRRGRPRGRRGRRRAARGHARRSGSRSSRPRDPVNWPELAEALARAGIPHVMERSTTVGRTAFGFALERLLTFAWDDDATRRDLFSFLRSPWSSLPRRRVDFVEGRLRGRAVNEAPAVEASVTELLGGGVWAVDRLRLPGDPRVAHRRDRAPDGGRRAQPRGARHHAGRPARAGRGPGGAAGPGRRRRRDAGALEGGAARADLRARVDVREDPTARVLVCDLRAARTLDADVVIVLGLEQGGIASRGDDAFLPDTLRDALGEGLQARRARRSRAAPALRRAGPRPATGGRLPPRRLRRRPPARAIAAVARRRPRRWWRHAGRRRGLADVAWTVEEAPTSRERARAVCRLSADARGGPTGSPRRTGSAAGCAVPARPTGGRRGSATRRCWPSWVRSTGSRSRRWSGSVTARPGGTSSGT